MKKTLYIFLLLTIISVACGRQRERQQAVQPEPTYESFFTDSTLRLDYVFCGDATHQAIYLQNVIKTGPWAGRRQHLQEPLLAGNGQIRVTNPATGQTIYSNSFSTLFQEWQSYEEARHLQRAFQNSFQIPFPKDSVDVEVFLTDTHGKRSASMKHRIRPDDILIRRMQDSGNECRLIWGDGKLAEAIDIVVVSEGYVEAEKEAFFADACRARDALLSHEPFAGRKDDFNIRAVFAPSQQSGPSVPHKGQWHNTLGGSHFDTFYSERYLTASLIQNVWDAIGNVPFEHLILLANTDMYGGGGIYNSITIMGSRHSTFIPVLVHEFGHAFGGLADEYFYSDMVEPMYPADTEPWEPNITTLKDFSSKWEDMLPEGTPVPTPVDTLENQDVRKIWSTLTSEQKALLNSKLGVYEGAGYQAKGAYRPVQECRMKINECEEYCPVCTRAILRMIDYYISRTGN